MGLISSQITSLTIVYSIVYSDADQRKHQSSASLAFVRGIHRGPVNSPCKWPVTRKMFTFDDVMYCGDIVGCWINWPEKDTVLSVKCDIREITCTVITYLNVSFSSFQKTTLMYIKWYKGTLCVSPLICPISFRSNILISVDKLKLKRVGIYEPNLVCWNLILYILKRWCIV